MGILDDIEEDRRLMKEFEKMNKRAEALRLRMAPIPLLALLEIFSFEDAEPLRRLMGWSYNPISALANKPTMADLDQIEKKLGNSTYG